MENHLEKLFYSGRYKDLLSQIGIRPLDPQSPDFEDKTFLQIGSLIFQGQIREAEVLYDRALKTTKPSDYFLCRCQFLFGIGSVRSSNYKRAASFFAKNQILQKKLAISNSNNNQPIGFYAAQGSAFFRFFKGQYGRTILSASKAYQQAYEWEFLYGQVLSLDLLGHSLCKMGRVHRGLMELNKALSLAKTIGNGNTAKALETSIVKYKGQFGVPMKGSFDQLKSAIANSNLSDTYSLGELYLELTRQQVLRGQGVAAAETLEKAGPLIYQHQNKRQSAVYSLRYAHLQLLNGFPHQALSQAQALKIHLDPKVDVDILKQAQGLIEKINLYILEREKLKTSPPYSPLHMPQQTEGPATPPRKHLAEDPIGLMIYKAKHQKRASFYDLKKNGLLSLLPTALSIPLGAKGIFLGPSQNEMILLDGANVFCIDRGVTRPIKKLIRTLTGEHFKSKEHIVSSVWGYNYDPSIHDNLLYGTISKFRNLLGSSGNWVEWSSDGYRLSRGIFVFEGVVATQPHLPEKMSASQTIPQLQSDPENKFTTDLNNLNIRQVQLLGSLEQEGSISVRIYAKRFGVTSMTAYRDLSYLHKAKKIRKVGRGRATVYTSLQTRGEF